MWFEKIAEGLSGPQIINDSKTPSGRVHVGSLRGVLIHDAIFRALQERSAEVKYIYGIDDYDPMDGLPADAGDWIKQYMGQPLCNIPAPEGSPAGDIADHYIREFLDVFQKLGVAAEIYRMRDVYRSGKFNQVIDAILKNAHVVRKVYAEVSKAERPDNWYPFQVVCEQCGKIGTTEVTDYDGEQVTYTCKPNLVKWAQGCGHSGKISPFDGNGKLPWKLEWVAKWHTLGITVEGAGKDHCTKGGSRDVAARCLREIFGAQPPLNVPYEFFLVSGAKMSSSKGVGTAARDMAEFLPPEILRFLMIRTPPKRTVNFSTDFEYIVKLFNEHDRLIESKLSGKNTPEQDKVLSAIEVDPERTAYRPVNFQLLTALMQMPHLEVEAEIDKRTEGGLSELDRQILRQRIAAARCWLDNYAADEDRVEIQQTLPASVARLNHTQRAFLHLLGENFPTEERSEDGYQKFIFDTARLTPIDQKHAFSAIYRALLDKEQGPKGGSLFSYLDKDFLRRRFAEADYSLLDFWHESAFSTEQADAWLDKHQAKLATISAVPRLHAVHGRGRCVVELRIALNDDKVHTVRVGLTEFQAGGADEQALQESAAEYLQGLEARLGLTIG